MSPVDWVARDLTYLASYPKQLSLSTSEHIPALDGVRGCAVLAVLVFHTLPINDHYSTGITIWNYFVKSCWVGVDLFFVLSGFLITRILCESKSKPGYFYSFYVRRALRILPLYFAVLICVMFVIPALVPEANLPPMFHRLIDNQIWVWTFLQNYLQAREPHLLPGLGHFWTLAVEEQFYVLWPCIVYWLSQRRLVFFSVASCILVPFGRLASIHFGYSLWAVRQLTYLRFDTLLFGALLYLLLRETGRKEALSVSISKGFKLLNFLALAAVISISVLQGYLRYESYASAVVGYSAVGVLSMALIYAGLQNRLYMGQFLGAPLLRWFGKYAYGIYVFSVPAILAFDAIITSHNRIQNPFLLALARLALSGMASTVLAFFSWHILEVPFLRCKQFLLPQQLSLAHVAPCRTSI